MRSLRLGSFVVAALTGGAACGGTSTPDGGAGTGGAVADSGGTGAGAAGGGATSSGGAGSGGAASGGTATSGGGGTATGAGGSDGSGGSVAGVGGSEETELSGPTPTNDPDFIASVSAYNLGRPKLSVWRRYKDAVPGKAQTCVTQASGDCAVFRCEEAGFEGSPDPDGFGADFVDAGAISVSFTREGETFSAEILPDDRMSVFEASFGTYPSTLLGGELLTFTLTGADVPALTRSIPFPTRLVTTTAAMATPEDGLILADSSVDLTLDWDGGAPGVIYQVAGRIASGADLLYCEFPSERGTGTIPAELLSQMDPGSQLSTMTASAWRGRVGGYDVSLATGAETVTADDVPVYVTVF